MAEALRSSTITRDWHNDWIAGDGSGTLYYSADMNVTVTGTVYDDYTLHVSVTPNLVRATKGSPSGAGFINAGGLCWGPDIPATVHGRWYEYDGNETWAGVAAQINSVASDVQAKSIIGFYCIDSDADVSGTFGSTAVGSSVERTFQVDISTGEVTELILGTWARWADTNPSSATYGDVYVGGNDWIRITMSDLFPDYYPWAYRESAQAWRSYNARGHYLQRKSGVAWTDMINSPQDYAASKVFQKSGAQWPMMPKIGEGRERA